MKRLLLFVCAMFVGTTMAEPVNTSNSFPINELMQPDYRYLNSAIYPNTGVYDGDVTVNALYDWDLFSPTAGNYLPANSTTITQCTAGNFCAGATNIHYDSVDQGITACSTLGDNSYTQSAVGSSLETDCYRDCSGNVTIEHATTITGNDYYGAGTDTCSATACEGGYHTDNNACDANVLTITWANSDNPNTTCTYGGSITTPPAPPHIPGKTFLGWQFAFDFSTLPLDGFINARSKNGNGNCTYGVKGSNYTYVISCNENFDDLQLYEWKNSFNYGTVYGTSLCSSTIGATGNPTESKSGQYCWCKVTGIIPSNTTKKLSPSTTLPWTYAILLNNDNTHCIRSCADWCSWKMQQTGFKRSIYGQSGN